ncbi:MAG: EAL domain-containing protein [Gemmatimonadetes bacterium]|nr:EAL domain-containing protein [Gemmatimonadota bacterium]
MDLFVARQPIFDARRTLAGYELLYRGSAGAAGADPTDPNRMSSDVIVQNFLEAGLERLTGGVRGFVNFTREMLLTETYKLFDPESIVVELVEDIVADAPVRAACEKLTASGYTLALDDFEIGGGQEVLLEQAKIVKVDLLGKSQRDIGRIAAHLRPFFVTMLAERVETAEVAWAAEQQGYALFQGYYFSRPETVAHKSSAVEALSLLPLLNMVRAEETSLREIERAFRGDPGLSYKLLQIANSTTNGTQEVESIRHAIQLVGRDILHRWLALLLTSSLASSGVHSPELLKATLVRARLLESMGGRSRTDSGSLFLVGLFSNMDVLLQLPIRELLTRVKFTSEVEGALLRDTDSTYGVWLALAEAYEEGQWDRVAELTAKTGVPSAQVPDLYMRALQWAGKTLDVLCEKVPDDLEAPPAPRKQRARAN